MKFQARMLVAILSLLAFTYAVYSPGLSGGYLFDDFVNLNAIGATGPVDNWPAFLRYLTSGTADPTGRPLALLSFLIDSRDWPSDPAPFLRTNLILHLINGSLLFLLLQKLGRHLGDSPARSGAVALLAAGLWLAHPLFVSTTLYVVQREAMLPATFILLGLLCYVRGRTVQASGAHGRAHLWMLAGITGGTALALLCKANGILLPLLAWVLEATVLQRGDRQAGPEPGPSRIRWALLTLPSLALLVYLTRYLWILNMPIDVRGWTIAQRLLTEPRVIVDYLQLLLVPRSVSTGLYNDGYAVSTGLLTPLSTLPSLLLVLLLPLLAWGGRFRFPALSAALLFFFAGHLLESSIVPLELYFEHRNYVPAMLLFWPLARGVCGWRAPAYWRGAIAVFLLGLLGITTFQRATLWGQPEKLATLWAGQNPLSSRAQATVAILDTGAGRPELALRRLEPLWKRNRTDLQLAFNYVNAACAFHGLSATDAEAVEEALQSTGTGLALINGWLGKMIESAWSGQCPGLSPAVAERWLVAVLRNPKINTPDMVGQDIEPLLAQMALRKNQPRVALQHYNRALAAFITPDVAASQASDLARAGFYQEALAHLDLYERLKSRASPPGFGMPTIHAAVLKSQKYWPNEMAVLRSKLHAEIVAQQANAKPRQ